jgi:catechol 2,3-dioxygenase-like lactoylglutathione lyase family enzyme
MSDSDSDGDIIGPPLDHDPGTLDLGGFSVSLAVADLAASLAFYGSLGFEQVGGVPEQGWVVLANGSARIGLFQGMFEKNILTFNPGLTNRRDRLTDYTDVRAVQRHLDEQQVTLTARADPESTGAAYLTLTDPDGNDILIDQFF